MTKFRIISAVLMVLFSSTAFAAETHEITLAEGKVSSTNIVAKVGDTLKIYHKDHDGVHALYSEDEHHTFDLSDMKHGDHFDFVLPHAGTFRIHCHIMKGMEIEVVVAE